MHFSRKPATMKCAEIEHDVSLNQSSAECRARHGCERAHCPHEKEFVSSPIDFQLASWRLEKAGQ